MTVEEVIQEFNPCCGVSLVMNSQDGTPRLYCLVCGLTIKKLTRTDSGWVITEWGAKGIRIEPVQPKRLK